MSKVGFLRISHWLAFVFDFVNTTDYCKQQVASVAPRLQQLTTPAVRRRSCSVYNSCGLTPSRTGGRVNIFTYFVFESRLSPQGAFAGGSECDHRTSDASYLRVFRSNSRFILLSFRDIITGWTTDDGNYRIICPLVHGAAISEQEILAWDDTIRYDTAYLTYSEKLTSSVYHTE